MVSIRIHTPVQKVAVMHQEFGYQPPSNDPNREEEDEAEEAAEAEAEDSEPSSIKRAERSIMRTRKKSWDQRRRERKLRMREVIANETPEQREIRLDHLRRYRKQVRDSETPEQREVRRAYNRDKMRRVLARKRKEKMITEEQQQHERTPQRARGCGSAGRRATGQSRRNVPRTWETLEEAAKRLLGDRWKYLETLMAERKSGISVAEASDMFQDEIRQGLIHVCCLCNRLLFQKAELQLPEVKLEDTAADGFLPDQTCESDIRDGPCPHQDTVQLSVV